MNLHGPRAARSATKAGRAKATVLVTTALVCYGLNFWEFRRLVERNGNIAWKLLQELDKRLRVAENG